MATILTVHGTGSSGPECGEKWWQKGSLFEAHIRELVAAKDGELNYRPVTWDGDNSESCRRTAARKLADQIAKLETAKEPYIIIGHSHGGSIIANMVQDNFNPCNLTHLSGVITIGTPYLTFHKRSLFSCLGLFGKSILVFVTWSVILATIWAALRPSYFYSGTFVWQYRASLFVFIALWLFVVIVARLSTMKRFRRYTKSVQKDCHRALAHRWVCLFDRDDEAILGLSCVRRFKVRLFARRFAVPVLSFASFFVFPLLLSGAALSTSIMTRIRSLIDPMLSSLEVFKTGDIAGNLEYLLAAAVFIITVYPLYALIVAWKSAYAYLGALFQQDSFLFAFVLFSIFIALLFMSAVSFFVTLAVRELSIGISALLSRVFDLVTWNAIRRLAFGSDLAGEAAVDAFAYPVWMPSGNNPIPQTLSDELVKFVNQEAIKSLPKLRQTIYELAFSIGAGKPANFIQSYLSWNEILHTSYFNIPHFRMLVGFVISKANGFHATQAFKGKKEFNIVAQWFDEIQGK